MAAAATSAAFKRLDLRDPAALFETHGAEEIRGLERQVRAEIEHKKEELRQMVGERYRDLIEAADTIGQMRRCAEGLVDAVKATDQYCARLRQAGSAAPRPPRDPQVSPGPRSPRAQPPADPPARSLTCFRGERAPLRGSSARGRGRQASRWLLTHPPGHLAPSAGASRLPAGKSSPPRGFHGLPRPTLAGNARGLPRLTARLSPCVTFPDVLSTDFSTLTSSPQSFIPPTSLPHPVPQNHVRSPKEPGHPWLEGRASDVRWKDAALSTPSGWSSVLCSVLGGQC